MQDNIDGFVQELVRAKVLPVPLSFSTLQDVFTYLNALPQKIVIVIDEYPYLKSMTDSAAVDSIRALSTTDSLTSNLSFLVLTSVL